MISRAICVCLFTLGVALDLGVALEEDNVTKEAGGLAVKFRGQSGKFTIYSKDLGEADQNKITFQIQELREVDAAGNDVGQKENPKHQVKSFATTAFDFTFTEDFTIGTSIASVVSFSTTIVGIGKLKVDTYLIQKDGVVGPNLTNSDSPQWNAFVGDVKFNIELSEWQWCNDGSSCTFQGSPQIGAFIDLDVEVKGPKSTPEKKPSGEGGKGQKYDMGGKINMDLTSEVDVDGGMSSMPEGYPALVTRGSKQIFTFRFPKFSTKTVYDPLLGTSSSESLPPLGAPYSQIGSLVLMLVFIMACS